MSTIDRITEYLGNGGLFNPEMMEHKKVRDLLIDCRDELTAANIKIETFSKQTEQRLQDWIESEKKLIAANQELEKLSNLVQEKDGRIKELEDISIAKVAIMDEWERETKKLQSQNSIMKEALSNIRSQKLDDHACMGDMALRMREVAEEALAKVSE